MKLTKRKLIQLTKKKIETLGFIFVKDSITGAQGLFFKRILINKKYYFLTLGLETSRLYDVEFTASFYVSPILTWSIQYPDFPKEAYQRIARFLTIKEREKYLPKKYAHCSHAGWWYADEEKQINNFIDTIALTENRLRNKSALFNDLDKNKALNEHILRLQSISRKVKELDSLSKQELEKGVQYFSKQITYNDVPLIWVNATELVLMSMYGAKSLNNKNIAYNAITAYRTYF